GMGQVYVRRISRGLALALVVVAINALVVELRLFMTFAGLLCTAFVIVLLRLSVGCDAVYPAWVYDLANQPTRSWRRTLTTLLAIFLLLGYPTPGYFQKRLLTSFRAYKIASGSMRPTLQRDFLRAIAFSPLFDDGIQGCLRLASCLNQVRDSDSTTSRTASRPFLSPRTK